MPTKQKHLLFISTVLLAPISAVFAVQDWGNEVESTWVGVVGFDNTPIRCGANESYYTIATANKGDFVRVRGKRQDWMEIDTSGNVFSNTVGYVKYPADDSSLFTITEDGGVATGELDVLAKNIESEELYRSWRPVLRLENGDLVQIVDSIVTDPGTLHRESYVVHTVQMPLGGVGWLRAEQITRATPEQIAFLNGVVLENKEIEPNIVNEGNNGDIGGDVVVGALAVIDSGEGVVLEPLSLVELEAAWGKITAEPVMGAEVLPLKDMYTELLANNKDDIVVEQIAGGRIKQLGVWAGLQDQRIRIDLLRSGLAEQSEDVHEFQSVMSLYSDYSIMGKLALSNTFDGRLRPFMYRIQDVKSGRTLGYLPKNDDFDLSGLVGQTIGVVGDRTWDPSWRVGVVDAKRFDILSPTTATVTPDIQ